MKIIVDSWQRGWKMRAHTATHLLHFHLDTLLKWTKQAWSLVDADFLRFDFATAKALDDNEIFEIQSSINTQIAQWYAVSVKESSLEEAKEHWAKAFFEDKYWDIVRVVTIHGTDLTSVELCGWTHVQNTSHIGAFFITGQESVSSGVRRITAVTGPKVAEYAQKLTTQRDQLAQLVSAQPEQLEQKVTKIINQLSEQSSQIEKLNAQVALSYLSQSFPSTQTIDRIINVTWTPLEHLPRKEVVILLKSQEGNWSRLLYSTQWNYALSHPEAKIIAQEQWLKWWWAPNFVQWRDERVSSLAA